LDIEFQDGVLVVLDLEIEFQEDGDRRMGDEGAGVRRFFSGKLFSGGNNPLCPGSKWEIFCLSVIIPVGLQSLRGVPIVNRDKRPSLHHWRQANQTRTRSSSFFVRLGKARRSKEGSIQGMSPISFSFERNSKSININTGCTGNFIF
jgi:hypothetical protein